MIRRHRILACAAVAGMILGAAATPFLFRKVEAYPVARVEVVGGRFLTAENAISATGIAEHSTLFDDFEPWRTALEQHPLVLRATVSRRLPDTIVFDIIETEPIALLRGTRVRPVDARGQVLPIDPAAFELDLPVLEVKAKLDSAGRLADGPSRTMMQAFDRVLAAQPWLAAWTEQLEWTGDAVRLRLRWPAGAEVILPPEPDDETLHAIRLTVADLLGPGATLPGATGAWEPPSQGGELARLARIDARFREQVVVRLEPSGSRGRARGAS